MSMLQVSRDDCTTAADVVARCRAVRERLKAQRAVVRTVAEPVAEPVVEPAVLVAEEQQEPNPVFIERRIVGASCALTSPPTVKSIIAVVCRHFGLSETQLLARRRDANIVWPRHVAMYLAQVLTCHSFPELGRRFGNRDHTTVLHAVRKVAKLRDTDEQVKAMLVNLEGQLAQ
jgi:hypothetical protein